MLDIRLTEEQFYSMTPREFVWLRERHAQEREYNELLLAIQTSTLANHSFNPPKKAYKPYDFMPSKVRERAESKAARRWTRKSFASELAAMRSFSPRFVVVNPASTPPAVS
jgi:hypothetical protein